MAVHKKFIIDREINLNDYDFLKTKIYSDNLKKIIEKTEKDKVFTIGLFGGWGTGKSSIIETSKQEFDQNQVKYITYDAWQYANDSFRRMFLKKLAIDLNYKKSDELDKVFYNDECKEVEYKEKLSLSKLNISLVAINFSLILVLFFLHYLSLDSVVPYIITLPMSLATLIFSVFSQLKTAIIKPHLFAPEQFEDYFDKIVSGCFQSNNDLKKLVIVIDNIDRCNSEAAYNLFSDIKTFLSAKSKSIVFIIPVDDVVLRKHITSINKNTPNSNNDTEEFLRKFFNVTICVKPYGEIDMFSFAQQINEKYELSFNQDTVSIASKEYAKSPRRIIKLFNNLLAEFGNYDEDFIKQNETLICCVLIIKEEYPVYYTQIINSPKYFFDKLVESDESDESDELKRFIRIKEIYIRNIDTSVLSIILTNTIQLFSDLDYDIKDAVNTCDCTKILEFIAEKNAILNYIKYKLDLSKKHKLTNDLVAYLDLIVNINPQCSFDNNICNQIDEYIVPYLNIIIDKSSSLENLCHYALYRDNQNQNSIKKIIIEQCKSKKNTTLLTAVLKTMQDEQTAKELSSIFTDKHSDSELELLISEFSNEQMEHLITDDYIIAKIKSIKEQITATMADISFSFPKNQLEIIFKEKKNIGDTTYETFFVEFANLTDKNNYNTRNNIAEILQNINRFLESIPQKDKYYNQVKHFYQSFSSKLENFDIFLRCENISYIKDIIAFVQNIINIGDDKIITQEDREHISKLRKKNNTYKITTGQ